MSKWRSYLYKIKINTKNIKKGMYASTKIRDNIVVNFCAISIGICLIFGIVSSMILYSVSVRNMKNLVTTTAQAYTDSIGNAIEVYKTRIEAVASNPIITDERYSWDVKNEMLKEECINYDFVELGVASLKGITNFATNISEEDYFLNALNGSTSISEPITLEDGNTYLYVSTLINNSGETEGVVYANINIEVFCDIVKTVEIGRKGEGFLIGNTGSMIANKNVELVKNETNYLIDFESDKSYQSIAKIVSAMIKGETGSGFYDVEDRRFTSYAPVEGTDGWSLAVSANVFDMMSTFYIAFIINIILTIVFALTSIIAARRIAQPIVKPIMDLVERIKQLSQGDLHSPVPVVVAKDETYQLACCLETTVSDINKYIRNIDEVVTEISSGNLAVNISQDFLGDFIPIKNSLEQFVTSMSETLYSIQLVSDQVAIGSEQLSAAALTLSEGALEQTSVTEELSISINEISDKVLDSATNAENSNKLFINAQSQIMVQNNEMVKIVSAMSELKEASTKILQVAKTIDDIALQTNLLSLNAAIEAARAGEAGKGFAVVANEVRTLSQKSTQAVYDTTELVDNTLLTIENATIIVEKTASDLLDIIDKTKRSGVMISEITEAANQQAAAITQVTQGVEQITSVVEQNSSSAEQNAATSEELAAQALSLKELISKFRLKKF
jgi:methyl-accepting chemotaxis protein